MIQWHLEATCVLVQSVWGGTSAVLGFNCILLGLRLWSTAGWCQAGAWTTPRALLGETRPIPLQDVTIQSLFERNLNESFHSSTAIWYLTMTGNLKREASNRGWLHHIRYFLAAGLLLLALSAGVNGATQRPVLAGDVAYSSTVASPCDIYGVWFPASLQVCPHGADSLSIVPYPALVNYPEHFSLSVDANAVTTLPDCGYTSEAAALAGGADAPGDPNAYCFTTNTSSRWTINWRAIGATLGYYTDPSSATVHCTYISYSNSSANYNPRGTTQPCYNSPNLSAAYGWSESGGVYTAHATHVYASAYTYAPQLVVQWSATLPFSLYSPYSGSINYQCGYLPPGESWSPAADAPSPGIPSQAFVPPSTQTGTPGTAVVDGIPLSTSDSTVSFDGLTFSTSSPNLGITNYSFVPLFHVTGWNFIFYDAHTRSYEEANGSVLSLVPASWWQIYFAYSVNQWMSQYAPGHPGGSCVSNTNYTGLSQQYSFTATSIIPNSTTQTFNNSTAVATTGNYQPGPTASGTNGSNYTGTVNCVYGLYGLNPGTCLGGGFPLSVCGSSTGQGGNGAANALNNGVFCGSYPGGTVNGAWQWVSITDQYPGPVGYTYAPSNPTAGCFGTVGMSGCNAGNYGVSDGGTPPSSCNGTTGFAGTGAMDPGASTSINCGIYVQSQQGAIQSTVTWYTMPALQSFSYDALQNQTLSYGYTTVNGQSYPVYIPTANNAATLRQPTYDWTSYQTDPALNQITGWNYGNCPDPMNITDPRDAGVPACQPNFSPSHIYDLIGSSQTNGAVLSLQNTTSVSYTDQTDYQSYNQLQTNPNATYTSASVTNGTSYPTGYLPENYSAVGGSCTPPPGQPCTSGLLTTIEGESGINGDSWCRDVGPGGPNPSPLQCTAITWTYYLPDAYVMQTTATTGTATYTQYSTTLESGSSGAPYIVETGSHNVSYQTVNSTPNTWTYLTSTPAQAPPNAIYGGSNGAQIDLPVLQEEPAA